MTSTTGQGLSKRSQELAVDECFLLKYLAACQANPWSLDNPKGLVNLGTAENYLCEDLLVSKLNEDGFFEIDSSVLHYYTYHGSPRTLKIVANFVQKHMKVDHNMDTENFAMVLGTCSALDISAHLIADPGDVVLCQSPHYSRIHRDFFERSLVSTYPVDLISQLEPGETSAFQLTVGRVKMTYEKAISEGKTVKGMVILNPSNPVGNIVSRDQLMPILEFLAQKKLWCIMDEIYALSTFNVTAGNQFHSALSFWKGLPDPQRVIWLWGMSKDFALAGARVSFVYSMNEALMDCVKKLTVFQCVPVLMHRMVEKFLQDDDWIDNVYLPTNHNRMKQNYQIVIDCLHRLGIPYVTPGAGFFVFADFRQYLNEQSFEDERNMFDKFFVNGLYMVPGGRFFCNEPGWFRIVFTVAGDLLKEGLERMADVLADVKWKESGDCKGVNDGKRNKRKKIL